MVAELSKENKERKSQNMNDKNINYKALTIDLLNKISQEDNLKRLYRLANHLYIYGER